MSLQAAVASGGDSVCWMSHATTETQKKKKKKNETEKKDIIDLCVYNPLSQQSHFN